MNCLCKIHNFIIDSGGEPDKPAEHTVKDRFSMIFGGAINLMERQIHRQDGTVSGIVSVPYDIMHGGEHFDDVDRSVRDRTSVRDRSLRVELPRERIFSHVCEQDLRRPIQRSY